MVIMGPCAPSTRVIFPPPRRVGIAQQQAVGVVTERVQTRVGIKIAGHQPVRAVGIGMDAPRRVGGGGEVAVGVQRKRGALAVWRDNGSRLGRMEQIAPPLKCYKARPAPPLTDPAPSLFLFLWCKSDN